MKILVVSDSHGNLANLRHIMGFGKHINAKAIIHAGDWNTSASVQSVLDFDIPLYSVLGNADISPEVKTMLSKKCKKFGDDFLIFNIDGRKIGVTHKQSGLKKYIEGKKVDIVFYGHLHSKNISVIDGLRVVRPGASVLGINLVVYDTNTNTVEFVNYE